MTTHDAHLHPLGQHSYWLTPYRPTDRPTLGVIAGTRGTLVVDAGNSMAHAALLLARLQERKLRPPSFVTLTHWHWDHVFGSAAFDVPTFAHVETARVVEEMSRLAWDDAALDARVNTGAEIAFCRDMIKLELPDRSELRLRPPEIAFMGELRLDLGGVHCEIVHVGGDHAADASVVFVPEDQVVFMSDCLYESIYGGPRHYTTAKLFPLIDRLLAFDAAIYVAGHHDEPMTRADLVEWTMLLRAIGELVEQVGPDHDALYAAVPQALGEPLNEEHREIVDSFLAVST